MSDDTTAALSQHSTHVSVVRTCASCGSRRMRYAVEGTRTWCFCELCAQADASGSVDWHISRSWPGTGTPCEDECPCPQEACGHVAQSNVRSDCAQHGIQAAKTIRSTHAPEDCPGQSRRECGHPADDGSGRVCRRVCADGRDYHGGGHWYADPDLDGNAVRRSTARWIVTGEQPGTVPDGDA